MSLLYRLLIRLGFFRKTSRYNHEQIENFHGIISELAQQEQRSEAEIHADLLAAGLAQRQSTHYLWDRWRSLSPREQQVTALVCLGYTNGQIGAKLGISHTTVKTHVKNIHIKYQLHSKDELRLALRDWDFREWD